MVTSTFFLLASFGILLNLKHFICEYILQSEQLFFHRMRYGSINSFIHTFHHAFGTTVAGLLLKFDLVLILGLVLIEAFIHYHVDWAIARFGAQSYKDKKYWQWRGAEEFMHHVTFILLILLVKYYLTTNS
jgi:hypothetical protein